MRFKVETRCYPRQECRRSRRSFRLRQFLPVTISRAAAAATSSRNTPSIGCRRDPAGQGRQPNRRAPGHPESQQRQKRQTLQRQAPGPVWNGGQKEAGHDGRHEAVEHFVDVPVARGERRGKFKLAVQHRQPGKNGKPGIERAEQEEGAKAIGKKGRALGSHAALECRPCSSPAMALLPLTHLAAVRVASSLLNRPAKICFARPGCVTAFACSSFEGVPTTIIRNHSHAVVWQALDSVDAGLLEGHRDLFVDPADKRLCALRDHACDVFGVVGLVGGEEFHGVAGRDLEERGFEYHRAFRPLVEHLDLELGGAGRQGKRQQRRRNGECQESSHVMFPLAVSVLRLLLSGPRRAWPAAASAPQVCVRWGSSLSTGCLRGC